LQHCILLRDKLVTNVVIRATMCFNLQCNNVARQVEGKCCPCYRTLSTRRLKSFRAPLNPHSSSIASKLKFRQNKASLFLRSNERTNHHKTPPILQTSHGLKLQDNGIGLLEPWTSFLAIYSQDHSRPLSLGTWSYFIGS